jgi:hypothetical protein
MTEEADALFAAGDYKGAREAYTKLLADPSLTPEQRAHVQARLKALTTDKQALAFGLITAAVVLFVYLLSRFWLGH